MCGFQTEKRNLFRSKKTGGKRGTEAVETRKQKRRGNETENKK